MRRLCGPASLLLVVLGLAAGCATTVGLRGEVVDDGSGPAGRAGRGPTLQWETFPRPGDPDPWLATARHVTYELRVWRAGSYYPQLQPFPAFAHPQLLVYSRTGLTGPRHTIETSLELGTVYCWSVRAWFEVDGQRRATPWSATARGDFKLLLEAPLALLPMAVLPVIRTALPP